MDPAALAARYAPILVFSRDGKGAPENFYPMDADLYIRASALYAPGPTPVVPRGRLTPDALRALPELATETMYLVFAADALLPRVLPAAVPARRPSWFFSLLDALTDRIRDWTGEKILRLLRFVPHRLPVGVWEEARRRYRPFDLRSPTAPDPVLYYDVTEAPPFLVLHYWFFYAYNDWGTGHGGHNDHEGDWESIHLFLEPRPPYRVRWLAYAVHGLADLEHATSPEVEWFLDHPVVYVGCGSHASYFRPGLHYGRDWALGDAGIAVGPAGARLHAWPRLPRARRPTLWREWRLQALRDTPWAWPFRGAWGIRFHFTGWARVLNPLLGISGPGGPVWLPGRGRQRPQWTDPLGWAGFRQHPWAFWKPQPQV